MDTGFTLHFKSSRLLALLYVLLGVISLAGIQASPLLLWQQWLLCVLVLVMIVFVVQKHALLNLPNSIVSLSYQPHLVEGQRWQVVTKVGQSHAVHLVLEQSVVTPYLTVLNEQPIQKQHLFCRMMARRSILILPDRVANADYRRLRVLLNWGDHQDQSKLV